MPIIETLYWNAYGYLLSHEVPTPYLIQVVVLYHLFTRTDSLFEILTRVYLYDVI